MFQTTFFHLILLYEFFYNIIYIYASILCLSNSLNLLNAYAEGNKESANATNVVNELFTGTFLLCIMFVELYNGKTNESMQNETGVGHANSKTLYFLSKGNI